MRGAKRKLERAGIAATAAIVAAMMVGCADSGRRISMHCTDNEHLLFNPSWAGLPSLNTPRGNWPATLRYENGGEVFDYRETIIDLENSFGALSDRHYRRFESVRAGHGYR
ncbi:MAG: hypothetical protein ACYTFA_12775 [Planctomycetota bacterium]|jgi:hypothetical protein